MLHLTQPIHWAGRAVVFDSGFCVLQGLVELKKVGVLAHALIKKQQYLFQVNKLSNTLPISPLVLHAIKGELGRVPFHIYGMKEPDYVMQIMSMYGTMLELGEDKKRHVMVNGVQQVHTSKYPEVVHNHYRYQDMIDNHNSL